jgi:flagellin
MKINEFNTAYLNSNTSKIDSDIQKIADPSKVMKNVNAFIQDVYENDINTSLQEINNFNNAIGFVQTADGALNSISDDLNQIKTLQVQANNATLNSDNLSAVNSQINKLSENINNTLTQTVYNDKNVFGNFDFNGTVIDTSMPEFDINNINDFENSLNNARDSIGAFTNEAQSKINNLSEYVLNTSKAKSQNETDLAKTVTDLKNGELKLNAQLLAQAHSINANTESLMTLLNGG